MDSKTAIKATAVSVFRSALIVGNSLIDQLLQRFFFSSFFTRSTAASQVPDTSEHQI